MLVEFGENDNADAAHFLFRRQCINLGMEYAMNIQSPSTMESRRFASRIMEAGSRFGRSYPALLACAGFAAFVLGSAPALAQTYLGTAKPYAVLAGSAITCTTTATVDGDLGISPNNASSITGPCIINGVTNVAAAAAGAKTDLVTAYNSLAGQACNNNLTGQDLGGMVLNPGVYCFADSAQLTGTLTLDAQGNPDAVFIFQIGSTLTTASNAAVSVINGGVATGCGISWQIGSSATLGTGTDFEGNIVALSTITLNTGAGVSPGRVLARNGAVTLDTGTVSALACIGYGGTGLPPPPGQGSITIVKNTVGGNGTFNFTGAQSFQILTSGGTGSNATAFASVAPGTYDVTETVPAGWSLTGLTCSNGSTVTLATATANVAVAADEAVTCTFTNTLLPPIQGQGSITIIKNTIGGDGTFNFSGAQSFPILTSGGTGSNATAFASVAPGTYNVTETVPAGWSLTGLTCSNGSTVTLATATANIAVAADEAVTCTFTNTRQGAIIIVKNTIGGEGTFDFTGAQSFSISTNGGTGSDTTTFASVVPGAYNVTETVQADWRLAALACSNGGTVIGNTATANVLAGETVICTFTNLNTAKIPIPTLADWALLMLAILLMAAGWLQYRRQR
ncbi:MAG: DUF3494 domain-containing protein [Betaproteobacteria bacterium]|nr:DUF3494 domain-containing protein [Betaproteobacteria bacterium]